MYCKLKLRFKFYQQLHVNYICNIYSSYSDSEDIEAYVKEMTKELATEIKLEIREVISQVEDVLDSTAEALDNSMLTVNSLSNITRYRIFI